MTAGSHYGTFAKTTSAATVDQSVTFGGVNQTPKAIIFWTNQGTAASGTYEDHTSWSYGWCDNSGGQAVVSGKGGPDLNAAMLPSGYFLNNACIEIQNGSSTSLNPATAELAKANIKTMDSDGFTITWTVNNAVAYTIHYIAFFGSDITNTKVLNVTSNGSSGADAFTGAGFQPTFAMGLNAADGTTSFGAIDTAVATTNTFVTIGIGAARSSSDRWGFNVDSEDGTAGDMHSFFESDAMLQDTNGSSGGLNASKDFTSFDSDGLTLSNSSSSANPQVNSFLLFKGGDWDVGTFTANTSTGNQVINTTNATGTIQAVMLLSPNMQVNNTPTESATFRLSIGAAANNGGTTITEGCIFNGMTDGAADMQSARVNVTTKCIRLATEAATASSSTTQMEADCTAMDATSFTLNLTTATAGTRDIGYVTLAGTFTAGAQFNRSPATDTVSISDASTTRILSARRVPSTDSSTISDSSLTRMLSATRAPGTDTATITDVSVNRSKTWPRVPSTDSNTITDSSLVRMLSATRTPSSDVITSGETPARVLSTLRLPSTDSTSVADISITQAKAYTRTGGPDTTGVSDSSLTRLLSAIRVPALDTVTVTAGTSTRMLSATRVPSLDTVATTENLAGGKVYGRIPSTDTTTIADVAITRLLSARRSPSDTTPSSESLIRILSAFRVPGSDTTTVADVSTLRIRSLTRTGSDNTAVVDSSLTRMLQASRSPSQDTLTISDSSLVRLLSALRTVSAETITVNENITATQSQSLVRTASDNTAIADGTLSRFLSATRVPSLDTVAIADSSIIRRLQLVRLVGLDTIATSENISRSLTTAGAFSRTASDTVAVAEASLIRLLSSIRTGSDTSGISESIIRSATRIRAPATDTRTIADVSVTRVRSLTRLPTQDTMNIVEASLIRLLSLKRNLSDTTVITEVQNAITHSRSLVDTVNITEPLLQRIVNVSRNLSDIVNISEAVFISTYHKFVFDTVVVSEQLFRERTQLSGSVTYATPDEVRPLLGNLGSQRTDDQINLAIDAAYDEINTKTNRIPPNDWKDTDHNFGIIKKLTRYIAAKEMAIGIKDFDTKPLEMEIEHLFNDLLTYDTTSDATQDIVGSSADETYALNEGGIIWSTRYRNLKKLTSDENSTTINPNT